MDDTSMVDSWCDIIRMDYIVFQAGKLGHHGCEHGFNLGNALEEWGGEELDCYVFGEEVVKPGFGVESRGCGMDL